MEDRKIWIPLLAVFHVRMKVAVIFCAIFAIHVMQYFLKIDINVMLLIEIQCPHKGDGGELRIKLCLILCQSELTWLKCSVQKACTQMETDRMKKPRNKAI